MTADGKIVAYDVLHRDAAQVLDPRATRVRFPVRPPVFRTNPDQGSDLVRLMPDEGWIEVAIIDDGAAIEVRAAHRVLVEMTVANAFTVRLVDERLEPGEVMP